MKFYQIAILLILTAPYLWADYQPHLNPAFLEKEIRTHIHPRRSMVLSAQVAGPLEKVELDLGEKGDGQKGFQVDSKQVELMIMNLKELISLRASEVESQSLRTQRAREDLEHQKAELTRFIKMRKSGGATEQSVTAQEHRVKQQAITLKEQEANLNLAKVQLKRAKVELSLQEDLKARHKGIAPIGWEVVSRHKENGEMVSPGEPILELVQLVPGRVVMRLSEDEAMALRQGNLKLNLGKTPLKWGILHLSPRVDTISRKRNAEILLTTLSPEDAGKEVTGIFTLPDPQGGLLIPNSYIKTAFGQKLVMTKEGKQLPIQIMRKSGENWVVSPDQIPEGTTLLPQSGKAK